MEKIKISLTHLAALLHEQNPTNLPELLRDAFSTWDDLQTLEEELNSYFTAPNWGILNQAGRGIYHFDGTSFEIFYKPDQPIDCLFVFQPIKDFADWVNRSYDNDGYPYPWEQSAWDLGYCTGDDDVDYNASYPYIIIAILELYLLQNKLTYMEFTCNYHS